MRRPVYGVAEALATKLDDDVWIASFGSVFDLRDALRAYLPRPIALAPCDTFRPIDDPVGECLTCGLFAWRHRSVQIRETHSAHLAREG